MRMPIGRTLALLTLPSLALSTLAAGCADFQFNLAVNSTASVLDRGRDSPNKESDVRFARAALPGTIATIDSFLEAAPRQPVFLELSTLAHVQWAFGFAEDELEATPDDDAHKDARAELVAGATGHYLRAHETGVRMVELEHKDFRAALKGDAAALDRALAGVKDEPSAKGLYWTGLALASAINLHRDDINMVGDLPKAVALLARAREIVPKYFNYGAAMSLGVLYASQGKAVGGDPVKSAAMFKETLDGTGQKFLLALVLQARYYATVTDDRKLFEETLKKVIDTDTANPDIPANYRLANELAKIRARRYLADAENLF